MTDKLVLLFLAQRASAIDLAKTNFRRNFFRKITIKKGGFALSLNSYEPSATLEGSN
jgi:hypothetical protein